MKRSDRALGVLLFLVLALTGCGNPSLSTEEGVVARLEIPGSGFSDLIRDDGQGFFLQPEYNSTDFSDPVTVVYSTSDHRLQKLYTKPGALEKYGKLRILTPRGSADWHVIGVSAYDDTHLLSTYTGFQNTGNIALFLDAVKNYRTMIHDFSSEWPDTDHLLILSTHLEENDAERFLVLAVPDN